MADIVPYSFATMPATFPVSAVVPIEQGMYSGVHIFLQPGALELLLGNVEAWFENRDEVILVDSGMSSKQNLGYIVLEWEECEIDPLFVSILHHDELVVDYSLYIRSDEV